LAKNKRDAIEHKTKNGKDFSDERRKRKDGKRVYCICLRG